MEIKRIWAMPNKWTFEIKPIKRLIDKYVGDGKGWIDPFAGMYSPAEFTNDINPEMNATYHLDAKDFVESLNGYNYSGVLFDPPYTLGQIKETYRKVGFERADMKHNAQLYGEVKDAVAPKIKSGGIIIHCGYHSNGFGKGRGFDIVEILLVAHGGAHYDTIVTIEQKMNRRLSI